MRALALAAALTLAAPASALVCADVTPDSMWQLAVDSPDRMLPVYGRFSKPAGPVTLGGIVALDMLQASFPARFDGHALTRRGFTHPMAAEVTVDLVCVDPICADFPSDTPVMALLTQRGAAWSLELGPCIDPMILHPSPAERHRLRDCLKGRCIEPANR